jgi:hypothetical protein
MRGTTHRRPHILGGPMESVIEFISGATIAALSIGALGLGYSLGADMVTRWQARRTRRRLPVPPLHPPQLDDFMRRRIARRERERTELPW